MRNTLLLFTCLVSCPSTFAQSWCSPGAEWIFSFSSLQAVGVRRAWYSGDTIVGGLQAKRIDQTIYAYQPIPPFGEGFTVSGTPMITREEGELVLLWDNISSSFDTLMWLGAEPGQHWRFPNSPSEDRFNVLDTGTTVVEGIALRYLVVQDDILGWTDTLRERIGYDYLYIDPNESIIVDFTTDRLQCYTDVAIEEFHGSMSSGICDLMLSAAELEQPSHLILPNPGTDSFTLNIANDKHAVTVRDASGRIVFMANSIVGKTIIDATPFAPGMYIVQVAGATGPPWSTRWLKL